MIAAVHQPNYIPWAGYFYKIFRSDVFVILDDVQYVSRSFINRNRIKTHQGELWLTVPVEGGGSGGCRINEVVVKDELNWRENHLKNIEMNYKRSGYFGDFYDILKGAIMSETKMLSDLNIRIIKDICHALRIKTEMVLSSGLGAGGTGTERIINICKAVGADVYLSGTGGSKYQDERMFEDNSIKLEYSGFYQEQYKQLWGGFAGCMSVIDQIFNCGYDITKDWNDRRLDTPGSL